MLLSLGIELDPTQKTVINCIKTAKGVNKKFMKWGRHEKGLDCWFKLA
jgi:hypothetical protein